jgi:hypothetical protein
MQQPNCKQRETTVTNGSAHAILGPHPLDGLRDAILPLPGFSETYGAALHALDSQIVAAGQPVGTVLP